MKRIASVMGPEFGVVVLARFRGSDEVLRVGDVVRPAHADEAAGIEIRLAVFPTDGFEQNGDVVRVARDDLNEAIVGRDHLVVDSARVGLTESELRTLRKVTARSLAALVVLVLVFQASRSAVDNNRGALN